MSGSFWILHSTPHFPAASQNPDFYFPEKEIIYGQTFLCMSLTSNAEVEQVTCQYFPTILQGLRPHAYSVHESHFVTCVTLTFYPPMFQIANNFRLVKLQ